MCFAQRRRLHCGAQTFTTLHSFSGADGATPWGAALVQAANGNLYGTTYVGGANNVGTVFKITPSGTLTTLYNFCSQSQCTDGAYPAAELVQATNGNLYGTTSAGGAAATIGYCGGGGCGTVFKITPSGTLTTLYSFCTQIPCTDGSAPFAGLVQATNGILYGTTYNGGNTGGSPNCSPFNGAGCGTVFKITPSGTFSTVYRFCPHGGQCTDGSNPTATLVQATNGDLYGTTYLGGFNATGVGTVFRITLGGTLTTLYSFCAQAVCMDGYWPTAQLVQASNGFLYGTTTGAGANGSGTLFKITPSGTLTTLSSFCSGCTGGNQTGENPYSALIQATDGRLYGTTFASANGYGTIFKINPSGTLTTTLYSFCSQGGQCTDGQYPNSALVQYTTGKFYGTTRYGGSSGNGTVFSLSLGLGPFVETQPTSGKVGAAVNILGNNLTGATSVTFNGINAVFTASASEIKTTVPTGATTGVVQVVTPSGTLSTNVPFRVR